eukprot:COSAG02_NODE_1626_length_11587_cov_49.302577_12_plen_61_part_00
MSATEATSVDYKLDARILTTITKPGVCVSRCWCMALNYIKTISFVSKTARQSSLAVSSRS